MVDSNPTGEADDDWPPPAAIRHFAAGDPGENPFVRGVPEADPVEIVAYSPEWPSTFELERELIARALRDVALKIEHVGSTAVPSLAAKPVVDIDLIVDDPALESAYAPALAPLGYALTIRENGWYGHRMLRKERPRINLHVFGRRCPEHFRHLLFRDWLRANPDDRARYERAKAAAGVGARDVSDYNSRKQDVVRGIYGAIFRSRGWTSPSGIADG